MIVNETYSDLPSGQCERCKNNDICKYKENVIEVNKKVKNCIPLVDNLPIEVHVNCKRFIKKESDIRIPNTSHPLTWDIR